MSTITYTVNSTPFLGENNQYHYFYKITNKLNGKFYYGIHSTNDLDDGYSGSGVLLENAIKNIETGKIFDSTTDASKFVGLNDFSVSHSIRNNIRCGGFHWKYI